MKKQKKTKAKVRDLKPRKQVKGGAILVSSAKNRPDSPADPDAGGEVARP